MAQGENTNERISMTEKKLTKRTLLKRLRELAQDDDKERAHEYADDLLLEYIGDPKITETFKTGHWWYA